MCFEFKPEVIEIILLFNLNILDKEWLHSFLPKGMIKV